MTAVVNGSNLGGRVVTLVDPGTWVAEPLTGTYHFLADGVIVGYTKIWATPMQQDRLETIMKMFDAATG